MWIKLIKKLPWRELLLFLIISGFLAGLYHMGYSTGHDNAARDGEAAVNKLQSEFNQYRRVQAERENAALKAWAARYQAQVAAGQQAGADFLEQITLLKAQNRQLQGRLTMLPNAGLMKKAKAIPLSVCLLAVSCASTTPRSDMTTYPPTPVIQTPVPPLVPALAQRPEPLRPLTPGYATQVSHSRTSLPTLSTTQHSAASGEPR